MSESHNGHILSIKFLTAIFAALIFLTAVTVISTRVDFGYLKVVVALILATTKALLVILYFMHLRYESRFLKLIVFMCFFILAIFIGMTFLDVAYR
jgi:cytochrome c oxidase subunit 4